MAPAWRYPAFGRRGLGMAVIAAPWPGSARTEGVGAAFSEILSSGRMRFAVSLGNRPYAFRNDRGELDGVDVAIARLIARGLEVEPEFTEVPIARRIEVLHAREAHVAVNLSITPARTRQVLFSTPYAQADTGVGASVALLLRGPTDLAGLRVGLNAGSDTEAVARGVLPHGARFITHPTPDAACEALLRGDVDAVVTALATMRDLIARYPSARMEYKFTLAPRWRGAAVNLGEHDLLRTLNTILFRAREEGLLAAIHEHFAGASAARLPVF